MKLLISGLGGSLFPYLHNKLKKSFDLYYVDANKRLGIVYKGLNFYSSPLVLDPEYWPFIKKIIQDKQINFYIPLIDEEILIAKNDIEGFKEVHVIAPTPEFASVCLNKFTLMNLLDSYGISSVISFTGNQFNWEISPPVFVKPISGRGSRGIKKIETEQQLAAYYVLEKYKQEEIIIQPLLEGIEYTVGVLATKNNDLVSISSKRVIQKRGITQVAVTENNDIIDHTVYEIVKHMKPCGPFNIQLILTPDNEIKIFEINPRFSTTSIMEYEGGVDLISLYIQHLSGKYSGEIIRPTTGLYLYRRWENLFYEK